jgi:Mucin-2 protein WxxW repeating region
MVALRGFSLLMAAISICFLGQMASVGAQPAAACPPGHDCPCTWSNWLDRDDPSGKGDYEDLASLVKEGKLKCRRPLAVQCRYKDDKKVWGSQVASYAGTNSAGAGYHCETQKGGWCVNAETKPKGSEQNPTCKDSEVRFCCLPE